MSCSDLTEATLAGASISLAAAFTIVFLLLAVSSIVAACFPPLSCGYGHYMI